LVQAANGIQVQVQSSSSKNDGYYLPVKRPAAQVHRVQVHRDAAFKLNLSPGLAVPEMTSKKVIQVFNRLGFFCCCRSCVGFSFGAVEQLKSKV
jgi:hypothetical protein